MADETQNGAQQQREQNVDSSIVSWVMTRVDRWENHRENNFDDKWAEYYRMWRGIFANEDSTRNSERSKIVAPALSQAIEATVAELEGASFSKGKWFDVSDDFVDKDKTDIAMWRDQMREDLEEMKVPSEIGICYLNGALYGTGIAKIILKETTVKEIVGAPVGSTFVQTPSVEERDTVMVGLKAIQPQEFVIDPASTNIQDALGMAHLTDVPLHTIQAKQADGIYLPGTISGVSDLLESDDPAKRALADNGEDNDSVKLVEYHGFVPKRLLEPEEQIEINLFAEQIEMEEEDGDLVESIVTIANGTTLLRAVANPYMMGDRCFIAYQHDTVPNQFWGRGVAEKGYNPQKALDAEMRGRIDAMALSIHPMMGMDGSRMPRGANFKVAPGKSVITNGDPNQILKPFNFGQVNNNTFAQSGELERMVQMGTGAMDSATPIGENRRNETAGGMSMIQGGSLKRIGSTLRNIEENFMSPLIHKSAWRFMQFAPDRYPAVDMKFKVDSSLGLVARELEQQQFASMMNTVPPESPAFWMLLKGVYEYSSLSNREQMIPIIDQMMQQSLQKQSQPEQQDPLVALKQQEIQLDAKIDEAKLMQKEGDDKREHQLDFAKLQLDREALALKREQMVLDAKIELATMEQDSMVTVAQMKQKNVEMNTKGGGSEKSKAKRRKISVIETPDGLEGIAEDILEPIKQPTQNKTKMNVSRVPGGFSGTTEDITDG